MDQMFPNHNHVKKMDISWNIKRADGLTISSYAFAEVRNLIKGIRETGVVDFVVRHNTKTSLDIEISCPKDDGRDNFAVAYIPAGAEKFKFLNKTTYNVFYGKNSTRNHFKITKDQGLPELKEYLGLVLEDLGLNMESLKANLILYKLPEIEIE